MSLHLFHVYDNKNISPICAALNIEKWFGQVDHKIYMYCKIAFIKTYTFMERYIIVNSAVLRNALKMLGSNRTADFAELKTCSPNDCF